MPKNGLTVLLYDEAQSEAWRAEIERILAESGLCAGLSGPFALAASARGCFPRRASRWKQAGPSIRGARSTTWARTARRRFCARLGRRSRHRASARRIWRRGDRALARLDEQEDAQYIRSLRAYLSDGLNLRRAAERLGVHRNTLAYRMRRIEARFALDLSDMNTCFELLSFRSG